MQPAFELLDDDAITDEPQHLGPMIRHLLRGEPRTRLKNPVSAVISTISDDSVHAVHPDPKNRPILDVSNVPRDCVFTPLPIAPGAPAGIFRPAP